MPPKGSTQAIGRLGEALACAHLTRQGLRLVTKNYHCRQGEIDLVMKDGEYLVFVEVRYRSSSRFGSAAESIDRRKQQRLVAAAQHYLQAEQREWPCRFDVVTVSGGTDQPACEWIKNGFERIES